MSALADRVSDPALTADPYATYRLLRDEEPVAWVAQLSSWAVSRYDDIVPILDDTDAFSSAGRVKHENVPENVWTAFAGFDGFFWSDPPAYTEHREIWARAFKPRLKGIPAIVERVVNELLDEIDPGEPFDGVGALAFPLPATVILELLGIPRTDRDMFRRVSGILISGGAGAADAIGEASEWLLGFLADRQRRPTDDVLSDVLAARAPVETMDPRALRAEVVDIVQFLLAGHETTTSSITSGLVQLLERPDDRTRFLHDRRVRMSAVEEILRYESPLQFIERRAAKDVVIGEVHVEADSMIRLLLGSANHDERHFDEPETFRIDRSPNPHLAFGYGTHVCLGAPLARIEIPIALDLAFRRFPRLRLDTEPERLEWRTNFMFHAIEHLPLSSGENG